ncbi:MAG: geranylgeranyl reductase family protein [Candidatus Thermoplasmatota archaeon]|nr:geranylgeranyl reductase family protein [Candidatus Thermoplasmatota archaeon]
MADVDYDVVIIGGGPIGGHLGRILSESDISVLILEEHLVIGRPFQCAGLVTPSAMARVGLYDTVLSDVWGARINSPKGTVVEIGQPDILRTHVVCRKLFDEGCVRQALDAGAHIWLDSRPTDANVVDGAMELTVNREGKIETVRCRLLCGADGAHSWTRRHFRLGRPKEFMVGFQAEVTGYNGLSDRLDMFTGESIAPGLFAWAIPNGDTHRIGLWAHPERLDGRSCEDLYDELKYNSIWSDRFTNVRETARYCGPIPSGVLRRIHKERVVLFGDAAGFCKPTTGGGIGPGFDQIHLLAPSLIKAIRSNRLSQSQLKRICKPVAKMRKELERARILRDLFVTSCDDDELEKNFTIFAKNNVIDLINEAGDIEKPVPLGIRLLKEVPEFRRMAAKATWALLTG